jgi:hypothetical protein
MNPTAMNTTRSFNTILPTRLAAVLAAVGISLSANAQQAELLPLPQSLEVIQGESFEISYLVHPAGQPLAVADMHLHFDPAYLEVVSVEVGASNFNVMTPAFDNAMGTIDVSAFQLGDESPQAGFELVKVTFLALNEVALTQAHHPASIFPRTILAFAGQELDAYAAPLEVTIHASDALSAEQSAALGLSLDLWPNPSNGLSYAAFSTDTGGEVTLTLYDLSGKVIAHHFHGNLAAGVEQRVELDIAALQAGVYLCKLNTRHGTVVRRLALTR